VIWLVRAHDSGKLGPPGQFVSLNQEAARLDRVDQVKLEALPLATPAIYGDCEP
jgi:hypothetical protein